MNQAKEAQIAGNFDHAKAAYTKVLQLRPGWGPAEFNLGLVYHAQKKYEDSVPLFTRALRHDSSLVAAYLFRGIGEFNLGYVRRALDSLQRFVRAQPEDPQGHFFLASAYFALEDYSNAALQYIEHLRMTSNGERTLYQLGECYLALAREQAKRLADAPDGKQYLSLIYPWESSENKSLVPAETPQELRSATLAIRSTQTKGQQDTRAVYNSFSAYMELAQRVFAKLAKLSPDSALLSRIEAQTRELQSRFEEAELAYQRAITRNDQDPESFIEYGRFKARLNQFEQAIQLLERALALDPYNADANSLLGEVYTMTGNAKGAVPYLQLAVRARPDDHQSRINLAQCLAKLDRLQEAIQVLESATADPDGRAHYILSGLYRRQGRSADAAQALRIFEQRRANQK